MQTLTRKLVVAVAVIAVLVGLGGGITMSEALSSRAQTRTYAADQARLSVLAGTITSDFYAWDDQMNMYVLTVLADPHAHQKQK
jgi:hypothetical protein